MYVRSNEILLSNKICRISAKILENLCLRVLGLVHLRSTLVSQRGRRVTTWTLMSQRERRVTTWKINIPWETVSLVAFYNQHFLGSFSAVLWTMCTCILIVVICIMFSFLGLFHLIKILSQKGFDTFCLFLLSDDYFKGSYLITWSLLFTCKNAFWSQLV